MIIAILPTEAEAKIYEDTVRLHILAPSDKKEDQELKFALRDAILENFSDELSGFENSSIAKEELSKKLSKIDSFSNEFVKNQGYDYAVSVSLTNEWYDTRVYEEFTLPCGYYSSLRVIIGEGEGQNWWCVLYPPICLDFATGVGYNPSEEALIMGKYDVKFKILELLSELCR
jgi:stage II sporulation protein R